MILFKDSKKCDYEITDGEKDQEQNNRKAQLKLLREFGEDE